MKLIWYELKKVMTAKSVDIVFIVLMLINVFTCILFIREYRGNSAPVEALEAFFQTYREHSLQVDKDYQEYQDFQKEQETILIGALENGNLDYEIQTSPNKYAPEGYTDYEFYQVLYSYMEATAGYPDKIANIIRLANNKMDEYRAQNISNDTFAYQYQTKIISIYGGLPDSIQFNVEYIYGWDLYFNYGSVNIYIFIMLLMVGTILFTQEKGSGIMPILRVARYGRMKTALAKIITTMCLSVGIMMVFTLTTWGVIGLFVGYSDASNPIQALQQFVLCPYAITIGEYFFLTIIFKIFAYMLFSALVVCISVLMYNYALTYVCGLVVCGLHFWLFRMDYVNADSILKNLNLVATSTVNPLFVRYRAFNLFGNAVDYVPFMMIVYLVLLIILAVSIVLRHNYRGETITAGYFDGIHKYIKGIQWKNKKLFSKKIRIHSHSIFNAEIYKTLIASRYFLLIIILFLVKGYLASSTIHEQKSYTDSGYKEYMTVLAGEINDEKRRFLEEERAFIDETLAKQASMQLAYWNGEITFDEYRSYLSDYNYAYGSNSCLGLVEKHVRYIEHCRQENREAWFVYDTGWKKLFFNDFDWTLYVAILLLFTGVFASEYDNKSSSGGFAQILRTTKYGRRQTCLNKYGSAVILTMLFTVIWNLMDVVCTIRAYDLPLAQAPLASIEAFDSFAIDMTIWQYILCFYCARLLAVILLTSFICSLSVLLRKNILIMSATVAVTLFPVLLDYFGISAFSRADYTAFMRATPMLLQNRVALIYIIISAVVCLFTARRAERVWNK